MDNQIVALIFCLLAFGSFADSFDLRVDPSEIMPSLTKTLTVNCTFNTAAVTRFSTLLALAISKSQNQQVQTAVEMVSLNALQGGRINVQLDNLDASVSGDVGPGGDAYLSLQWSYPSDAEAGLYECEARGIDDTAELSILTKTAEVTVNSEEPTISQLMEKVNDLQREIGAQQPQAVSQCCQVLKSQLDNMNRDFTETVSDLRIQIRSNSQNPNPSGNQNLDLTSPPQAQLNLLWKIVTILSTDEYHVTPVYDNHVYVLSKENWANASVVEGICERYGGYLAEIDDEAENDFIKDFVDQFPDVTHVLLGGTDEATEGTWVFGRSRRPVVFTNWRTGRPCCDEYDCLGILRSYSWQMYDESCVGDFISSLRYLCEIPDM